MPNPAPDQPPASTEAGGSVTPPGIHLDPAHPSAADLPGASSASPATAPGASSGAHPVAGSLDGSTGTTGSASSTASPRSGEAGSGGVAVATDVAGGRTVAEVGPGGVAVATAENQEDGRTAQAGVSAASADVPPPGAPVSAFPGESGTPPADPRVRLPRVESLTGLRWWAAFFVFAHHMTNLAPLPIHDFLQYGTSGVTFFFVLSGFVLTWSAQPGTKIRTFYRRRFARIWPAHAVALLLAVFVFYRFDPPDGMGWIKPFSVTVLVLSLFLLHGWSNDPTVLYAGNPASWTLSVEAFFYAYFPFIYRATAKLKVYGGLILCVAAVGIGAAYKVLLFHNRGELPILPQPVLHSVAFVFGIGAAIVLRSGWRPRIPVWLAFVITGAGVYLLWYAGNNPAQVPLGTTVSLAQKEVLTLLYGFLIFAVAARDTRGGKSFLRSKPMVALGQWSYAFYLLHATILYGVKEQLGLQPLGWSNLYWYAGICAISIFASWLLYKFVEHPLERKLRGPR